MTFYHFIMRTIELFSEGAKTGVETGLLAVLPSSAEHVNQVKKSKGISLGAASKKESDIQAAKAN